MSRSLMWELERDREILRSAGYAKHSLMTNENYSGIGKGAHKVFLFEAKRSWREFQKRVGSLMGKRLVCNQDDVSSNLTRSTKELSR